MDSKHEVICIEAKQVFDFCFQEERVERSFPVDSIKEGSHVMVDCEIDTQNIICKEVSPRQPVDPKKNKFLICLAIQVPVTLRIVNKVTGHSGKIIKKTITVLKQVVLCVPAGTEVQCEVTGNCCCIFDDENDQIDCVFNFCIVIKSKATVQILVPTLGFCMPKECKAVPGGCPPFVPSTACGPDCD